MEFYIDGGGRTRVLNQNTSLLDNPTMPMQALLGDGQGTVVGTTSPFHITGARPTVLNFTRDKIFIMQNTNLANGSFFGSTMEYHNESFFSF